MVRVDPQEVSVALLHLLTLASYQGHNFLQLLSKGQKSNESNLTIFPVLHALRPQGLNSIKKLFLSWVWFLTVLVDLVQVGLTQSVLVTEVSHDGNYLVGHNKSYDQVPLLLLPPLHARVVH